MKNKKEKNTVNQNSTENVKGNENAEKEVRNTQEKEDNIKARSTKKVTILGDSIIKHLNSCELSKKVSPDCRVYVKHFSGATTDCMKDCVKPSLRNPPDHFIFHVWTNYLISKQTSEEIAASIISLASSVKGESYNVSISSIILRTDDKQLHQKGCEVNRHAREKCKVKNVLILVLNQ